MHVHSFIDVVIKKYKRSLCFPSQPSINKRGKFQFTTKAQWVLLLKNTNPKTTRQN